jgi:hypothetical protein
MSGGKDNLIPMSERSEDEARELGRKGGKASGRTRRERKSIREGLNAILAAPVKDKITLAELKQAGADKDAQGLLLLRLYQQAINGDVAAAKLVLTAIGEADPAAQDIANARLELEYLRLEASQLPATSEESGSNFIEALNTSVAELFPNATAMLPPEQGGDAKHDEE